MGSAARTVTRFDDTTAKASVGTSYAAAKAASFTSLPSQWDRATLTLKLSSISSATKITAFITDDSTGDPVAWMGETENDITTGVATAADGSVSFYIPNPVSHQVQTLYAFFKTDAGTVTVDAAYLTVIR